MDKPSIIFVISLLTFSLGYLIGHSNGFWKGADYGSDCAIEEIKRRNLNK